MPPSPCQSPGLTYNLPQVKKIYVEKRENPIVNRLNKTKVEKFPDLKQEKEDRQKELRQRDRAGQLARVSVVRFTELLADKVGRVAKGRGPDREGAQGESTPEGPCVRRLAGRGSQSLGQ